MTTKQKSLTGLRAGRAAAAGATPPTHRFTLLLCWSGLASQQSNFTQKQLTNYGFETNDPMAPHHWSVDSNPLQNETKLDYLP